MIQSGRLRPTPFSPPPLSIAGAGRRSRSSIQVPHRPPPSRSSSRHFQDRSLTPVQKAASLCQVFGRKPLVPRMAAWKYRSIASECKERSARCASASMSWVLHWRAAIRFRLACRTDRRRICRGARPKGVCAASTRQAARSPEAACRCAGCRPITNEPEMRDKSVVRLSVIPSTK